MSCLTCTHWNLRKAGELARMGLAACAKGESFRYLPGHQGCSKHQPLAADLVAKRQEWLGARVCR